MVWLSLLLVRDYKNPSISTHRQIEAYSKWGFFRLYDTTNLVFLPHAMVRS